MGDAVLFGEIPERVRRGVEGRAVPEHQRRPQGEAAQQPVPHHPAERGEVEHPVALADIGVQAMLLQVRQQRAARAVDDAFRLPGGAGGIEDEERAVERPAVPGDRAGREAAGEFLQQHRLRHCGNVRLRGEIGDDDHRLDRRQAGGGLGELRADVVAAAGIFVAVHGEQDARLDLAEAVQQAGRAEVGRARGEDRAARRRRRHDGHGFRHVRQPGGHPVALADARRRQRLGEARGFSAQAVARPATPQPVLAPENYRRRPAPQPQQVLRIIEPRAGEEARARHAAPVLDPGRRALVADNAGILPEQVPEGLRLRDRPAVQGGVIVGAGALLRIGARHEGRHVARRPARGGRFPQEIGHGLATR